MTVPACPAYCSRLRLRPRPPTDRKQETGTGSKKKHPTQQVQTQGRTRWTDTQTDRQTHRQTDGRMDGWMDGSAPLYLSTTLQRLRKKGEKKKKNLKKKKKKKQVTDPYMYQNLEAILLFLIFNPPQCSSSSKWKTMKKVLIFVTSWISLCRHINFSTIR